MTSSSLEAAVGEMRSPALRRDRGTISSGARHYHKQKNVLLQASASQQFHQHPTRQTRTPDEHEKTFG